MTDVPPLQIAMLVYPRVTLLDFVGPLTALGPHGQVHLVWKTLDPVPSDTTAAVVPTTTLDDCPRDLDVLFVPGGLGTPAVMADPQVLRFLADRGERAGSVTAVCSGSLILAAAGLLQGYRATTHWSAHEVLAAQGVTAVRERVVVDRNRITGGGVTAGIDFGLVLLARLRGEPVARVTQLLMEYDPAPPFDAGSPGKAGPEITATARAFIGTVNAAALEVVRAARPA